MTQKEDVNTEKGVIAKTLDWAYTKAVTGFTGVDSAYELANDFMQHNGTTSQQVDSLIKWQVTKAAASGFVTGLGGVVTMPITVPANIASVLYVQIRMICAIAHMGGHDIRDDKVKTFIYIAMVGNGAKELLKNLTVKVGERLLIKAISSVNKSVSIKLASKIGEKSAASVSKAIPILGGVVGGSLDAASTRIVGKMAKKIFIDQHREVKQAVELTVIEDTDAETIES